MAIRKIADLMTATCARSNHNFGMLIVDLGKKIGRDLEREIIFLRQHSKRSRHSAATGVEHCSASSRGNARELRRLLIGLAPIRRPARAKENRRQISRKENSAPQSSPRSRSSARDNLPQTSTNTMARGK